MRWADPLFFVIFNKFQPMKEFVKKCVPSISLENINLKGSVEKFKYYYLIRIILLVK